MPCNRATSVGDTPGTRLCAAIVCFCSLVQRRRRSPRGIKSIRRVGALLRLLVCALSDDPAVSAESTSVSMGRIKHTQPWKSHMRAAQPLLFIPIRLICSPGGRRVEQTFEAAVRQHLTRQPTLDFICELGADLGARGALSIGIPRQICLCQASFEPFPELPIQGFDELFLGVDVCGLVQSLYNRFPRLPPG